MWVHHNRDRDHDTGIESHTPAVSHHRSSLKLHRTALKSIAVIATSIKSPLPNRVQFQVFNDLFDAAVSLKVKTPSFQIPPTEILLKKRTTKSDNTVETTVNIERVLKKQVG
jgi:hypothetical protein